MCVCFFFAVLLPGLSMLLTKKYLHCWKKWYLFVAFFHFKIECGKPLEILLPYNQSLKDQSYICIHIDKLKCSDLYHI